MYCTHCGEKIQSDGAFCSACGKPVKSQLNYAGASEHRLDQIQMYNDIHNGHALKVTSGGSRESAATASLVLGILGIFIRLLGIIPVSAIIFGLIGRKSKNRSQAIAGIVLGAIGTTMLVISVVVAALYLYMIFSSPGYISTVGPIINA